jgi:hypothetical protein
MTVQHGIDTYTDGTVVVNLVAKVFAKYPPRPSRG